MYPSPYYNPTGVQYPGPQYNPRPPVKLPPSCLACKRSKVRCDRVFPCERCKRLNRDCIPQTRRQGRPGKAELLPGDLGAHAVSQSAPPNGQANYGAIPRPMAGGMSVGPGSQRGSYAAPRVGNLEKLYPRPGSITVPSSHIPSLSGTSQRVHFMACVRGWLDGDRDMINVQRVRRLLSVWQSYQIEGRNDCTEGLADDLSRTLNVTTLDPPLMRPEDFLKLDPNVMRQQEMVERFGKNVQCDQDGAAVCCVSRLQAGLGMTANDRFSTLFLSLEEMSKHLTAMIPELIWEGLIYTKAYKKLYWEQMARVGCTVTGISADSAQMLQVIDRYGIPMQAFVRIGMCISDSSREFAIFISILPVPMRPNDPPLINTDEESDNVDKASHTVVAEEPAHSLYNQAGPATPVGVDTSAVMPFSV